MNIVAALNSKYMRYTYVMLTSLFEHNKHHKIHVYLLENDLKDTDMQYFDDLSKKYKQIIEPVYIDKNSFPKDLKTTESWTLETYFRLLLIDVLPMSVDRVLYLDVDMIVNKPLDDLYDTDFEGNLFCACADMTFSNGFGDVRDELFADYLRDGFTYFNAGMMLWNLNELRKEYSFAKYMQLAKDLDYSMLAFDQDLLNYMHVHQVKFIDEYTYDLFSLKAYSSGFRYNEVKERTAIIHFAGMKPWEGQYIHYDVEKLWWDYAKMTPFYQELLEEYLETSVTNPFVYNVIANISEEKRALMEQLGKASALCERLTAMIEEK